MLGMKTVIGTEITLKDPFHTSTSTSEFPLEQSEDRLSKFWQKMRQLFTVKDIFLKTLESEPKHN